MSQGPLGVSIQNVQGSKTSGNLAASSTTLVKSQPGRIEALNVVATFTTVGVSIYDSATTAGTAAANLVYQSTSTVALGTVVPLDFPMQNGIVVVLGASGAAALSFS